MLKGFKSFTIDNYWTVDDYHPSFPDDLNHAVTVVGYNDNFGPYNEEGKTRYGAFKVVNSWGPSFSSWWISYEAMKKYVKLCYFFIDEIDYEPKLISVFDISHPCRSHCKITIEIQDVNQDRFYLPSEAKTKFLSFSKAGNWPFPDNKIILDITELINKNLDIKDKKISLKVSDSPSRLVYYPGQRELTHFSVEYYDDYKMGAPTIKSVSDDPPIDIIENGEVTADVVITSGDVSVQTDDKTYVIGDTVDITIKNNGNKKAYFYYYNHWIIEQYKDEKWNRLYPASEPLILFNDSINPGEIMKDKWDIGLVEPGEYRVTIGYSYDGESTIFKNYACWHPIN